jgi:GT2 family glycosyltransferase
MIITKNKLPCASIVIPLFNRVELTRSCWQSLLENTAVFPFEVIFVDNASTDETGGFLESIAGNREPAVILLANRVNEGFARACNQGAMAARSNMIIFLNNDTIVHENWLSPLIQEFADNPKAGVVGSRLLYPDGSIQHAGVCINRRHIPYHIFQGASSNDPHVCQRRTFRIVTGACMSVRKDEFFDLGGFDEKYINGHEDVDLCLRYGEFGKQVVYRSDSVVTHFESQSEGRMDNCQMNTHRTLRRWHNKLMQDDFNYDFVESNRGNTSTPLQIAIKTPTSDKLAEPSSLILRAERLASDLCRLGHRVQIHANPDWGLDDRNMDIVLVIPGEIQYLPKPYSRNVLWVDKEDKIQNLSKEEREHYSMVFSPSVLNRGRWEAIPTIQLASMGEKLSPEDLETLETTLLELVKLKPCTKPISPPEGKVAILMATYNRRHMLAAAIQSIIGQTHQEWELIIVNDGGEDASDIVDSFDDQRIFYYNNKHGSKGKAVNKAFSLSSGDYIAYLDDDDIWFPAHLESALFMLRNLPGVEMTYADTLITMQEADDEGWKTVYSLPKQCLQVSFIDLLETNCIPGISVVHTRALFETVGGMDEKLEVLIDFDMWRRLAMHTTPYHISEVTAEHFIRPSGTTTGDGQVTNLHLSNKRRYLANACRVLRKKMPVTMPEELQDLEDNVRKKVQSLFLNSQGDYYSEIGNYKRAAMSYKLSGRFSLNACRELINAQLSNIKNNT